MQRRILETNLGNPTNSNGLKEWMWSNFSEEHRNGNTEFHSYLKMQGSWGYK